MEVFSTQHAEVAGWARAYMDVVHAAGERREHP